MIFIDDELFKPYIRVEIINDVDGVFRKNYFVIFTINEKCWNMASLHYA